MFSVDLYCTPDAGFAPWHSPPPSPLSAPGAVSGKSRRSGTLATPLVLSSGSPPSETRPLAVEDEERISRFLQSYAWSAKELETGQVQHLCTLSERGKLNGESCAPRYSIRKPQPRRHQARIPGMAGRKSLPSMGKSPSTLNVARSMRRNVYKISRLACVFRECVSNQYQDSCFRVFKRSLFLYT